MMTVWVVVLVTVDRYIAICHPLRGKVRTLALARRAVALVVLISVIYNIPLLLEREIKVASNHCTGAVTSYVDKAMMCYTICFITSIR